MIFLFILLCALNLADIYTTHRILGRGGSELNPLMACLLYTSPSPRDRQKSRMPSSA